MAAYRFCRTDDIGLLVDALNRCWAPYVPGEPAMTPGAFKRLIRDLQIWCSSCMVAFSGSDPIGVLIGAKRSSATLVYRIAVHPDHLRQGHGRHLLESLGSKLAILGPPRIVAEVPETCGAACGLFEGSGYVEEARLTDYVWQDDGNAASVDGRLAGREPGSAARVDGFVIPITVDDLAANGLLDEGPSSPVASASQVDGRVCWERSVETLTARKDEMAGLAIASDERIEACLLYTQDGRGGESHAAAGPAATVGTAEIVLLRSFVEDGGARLQLLLAHLGARRLSGLRFPKVHPAELSHECLETQGFRAAAAHRQYAAALRPGSG